jgi:hypothetical protein
MFLGKKPHQVMNTQVMEGETGPQGSGTATPEKRDPSVKDP